MLRIGTELSRPTQAERLARIDALVDVACESMRRCLVLACLILCAGCVLLFRSGEAN